MIRTTIDLVNSIERRFPFVGKWKWKAFYDFLAWRFPIQNWVFMNYGYADEEPEAELELAPEDEVNRYFIAMYARALSQIEVSDRDILEVGCGRGGGSAWIARTQKARSVTGIDISKNAIDLCQKLHRHESLKYLQGDAENLPFSDESFDIVINVESSHTYPSISKFIQEVTRVLRPNGYFSIVDFREIGELDRLKSALSNSDLELVGLTDITANVVKALELTESLKMEIIRGNVPDFLLPVIETFAAVKGTKFHEGFVKREVIYIAALLKKGK